MKQNYILGIDRFKVTVEEYVVVKQNARLCAQDQNYFMQKLSIMYSMGHSVSCECWLPVMTWTLMSVFVQIVVTVT